MIGNSSLLAAVLTVVSVLSLSLLSLFCLRCKKKSKVIHEDHQIYNPQTFQRGGSRFAVTQSKTVTRANQITPTTVETRDNFSSVDEQSDYQNVDPTYVAPIPNSVYANETDNTITDVVETPGIYENFDSPTVNDDDDYENTIYLEQRKEEEDEEPDYVNQNVDS